MSMDTDPPQSEIDSTDSGDGSGGDPGTDNSDSPQLDSFGNPIDPNITSSIDPSLLDMQGFNPDLSPAATDAIDNNTTDPAEVDPSLAPSGVPVAWMSPDRNTMEIMLMEPGTSNSIHFPVNPSKIQVTTQARVQTFEPMQGLGTINIPHGTGPYKIQFDGIFPGPKRVGDLTNPNVLENSFIHDPVGYANDLGYAWGAITRIDNWQHPERKPDSQPIKLVFAVNDPPIVTFVYIESFAYEISGGFGDINYNIVLAEWRDLLIFTDSESPADPTASSDTPGPTDTAPDSGDSASADPNDQNDRTEDPTPSSYSVVPGDSLYVIAKKVYGDGSRWSDIYGANTDTIGSDPDQVQPGMVLNIP